MEKRKVSTFLANEEKKRLPKSGKDKCTSYRVKDLGVFFKRRDVFLKRPDVFKKRLGELM